MTKSYDVAIIGGGIIGSSIAAHLAEENLSTVLINTNTLGLMASSAAAGLLTPFQLDELENPLIKDFCFKSNDYFSKFCEKILSHTNVDIGFSKSGTLYLLFSNYEFAKKELENKELKTIDPNITFLNKNEVTKIEPNISKDIVGAYHYPQEGYINNPKFLKAINQFLIDKNISYANNIVEEIIFNKNKIEKLLLSNGDCITAKKYVISNGAWANKFLKIFFNTKEDLIKPIKGEILQFGGLKELPIKKIIFCNEGYALPRPPTNQFEKPTLLVGSTAEEVNLDSKEAFYNTLNGIISLTKIFKKLFPQVKDLPLISHWAGLRPKTNDSIPIIGKSNQFDNLLLATGHFRSGILMGPLTGKIIADLIVNNKTDFDLNLFSEERFLKKLTHR